MVDPDPQHAATMVRFALRAQEEAAMVPRPDVDDGSMLSLRIGKQSRLERGTHQLLYPIPYVLADQERAPVVCGGS